MTDTAERVRKIIVEHLGVDAENVTDDAKLVDDLGCDSLDSLELVIAMEEEFSLPDIPDDQSDQLANGTVAELVAAIEAMRPPQVAAA